MKRRFFLAIAISAIVGFMAILLWPEFIREIVLIPVSYLLWIVGLLYRSFDQQIWWTALIILTVILAWTSLEIKPGVSRSGDNIEGDIPNRVQRWRKRLDEADRGTYMQWRLAQHLSNLVYDALSFRTGLERQQIEQNIEIFRDNLPDELVAYLRAARGFETDKSISRRIFSSQTPQPLDLPPEAVSAFLEEFLELDEVEPKIGG